MSASLSDNENLFDEETASVEVFLEREKGSEGKVGELSPYYPKSWFCPVGIRKVLRDLEPKLPDVGGSLFLTLTIDPSKFTDPDSAFDQARDRIRRMFHRLRRGVDWKGKRYVLDKQYCTKVEFHDNGWPHFHCVFLTKRFLPGELLNALWKLGRTNVTRISNKDFKYLLKYVTKSGEIPDWVKERGRIRIFQSSRGFFRKRTKSSGATPGKGTDESRRSKRIEKTNIGERLRKWERTAVLKIHRKSYKQFRINQPYSKFAASEALRAAREKRYLGNERFVVTSTIQIEKISK